jgi:NADH:ubiquinone reductase (H+-translocating)
MRAQRSLEKLDVEVLVDSPVECIDAVGVAVSGKTVIPRTVLRAAGVKASPAAKWLRARTDNAGRVKVAPPPNVSQRALRICSSLLSNWQTSAQLHTRE